MTSIDPATSEDSDLAAFGAAVGNRRIVLLTEATHGDGATFQLKTRLVKYLHETKGFDVLFIESGMYDVTRIQQRLAAGGDSISVQAPGRIFYMYSRTDLGQQMLKYVDQTRATATPLEPWGDDVPMNGVDSVQSLLPNLQAFLVAHHSTLPQGAGWAGWLRVAQQSVALVKTTPISSVDSASFLSLSPALIAELCSQADTPGDLLQSPAYWCRIAKGVQADYTHLWSATDVRTPTDLRDITAAGNIEWALDGRLAGRKAIVWLHAIHGDNGFAGLGPCAWAASQECGPGWTNVGTDLRRAYGDQVYIANITAGGGTYDTYNTASSCGAASPGFVLATPGSNSLEYYLGAGGQPRFMAWPADAAGRQRIASLTALEEEFNMATPSHFGSAYQGLFYLPRLAPIGTNCAAFPVVAYP
ncbi:MAG: erythromycin esterase family protein [Burkholderiaceae bacterium]